MTPEVPSDSSARAELVQQALHACQEQLKLIWTIEHAPWWRRELRHLDKREGSQAVMILATSSLREALEEEQRTLSLALRHDGEAVSISTELAERAALALSLYPQTLRMLQEKITLLQHTGEVPGTSPTDGS